MSTPINSESAFKNVFCASVKKQGGYTFKIAASLMNGLPDLYCAMPGYIPLLLELKWMKIANGVFNRKIPYRPMQQEILNNCNKVYAKGKCDPVAFTLIGLDMKDGQFCLLYDPKYPAISNKELKNNCILIRNEEISITHLFSGHVPPYMEYIEEWQK